MVIRMVTLMMTIMVTLLVIIMGGRKRRRAYEKRRVNLRREQGVAFARAQAAGFGAHAIPDLAAFADFFGAERLR